jgi:ribose-phosphate pyrophosphokinase
MIVAGTGCFAQSVAEKLNAEFCPIKRKGFPDKEVYVRFQNPEQLKNEDVVLVVRGRSPDFDPNRLLIEALFTLRHLKNLKSKVCLVMPYIPYARQDKAFLKGEVVSIRLLRAFLKEQADLTVTVASHDFREEGWIEEKIFNIDGTGAVIDFLKEQKYKKPFVIAPDMGADEFVKRISMELKAGNAALKKERDRHTGQITTEGELKGLFGSELIIYDDMIATGGTLFKAIEKGLKANAGEIICVAVHPVLAGDSYKRIQELKKKFDIKFHASDTIDSPISDISMASCIAGVVKREFL